MHNGTTIDELLHIAGLGRCCYSTWEFRGDTQEGKQVHCTNPPTWMDARGNLFCDVHPTPKDADEGIARRMAVEAFRYELRRVERLGDS